MESDDKDPAKFEDEVDDPEDEEEYDSEDEAEPNSDDEYNLQAHKYDEQENEDDGYNVPGNPDSRSG